MIIRMSFIDTICIWADEYIYTIFPYIKLDTKPLQWVLLNGDKNTLIVMSLTHHWLFRRWRRNDIFLYKSCYFSTLVCIYPFSSLIMSLRLVRCWWAVMAWQIHTRWYGIRFQYCLKPIYETPVILKRITSGPISSKCLFAYRNQIFMICYLFFYETFKNNKYRDGSRLHWLLTTIFCISYNI